MSEPTIPWYKSTVLVGALTAFVALLSDILLSAPTEIILAAVSGDRSALTKLGTLLVTGLIVAARARSKVQPVTLTDEAKNTARASKLPVIFAVFVSCLPFLGGCQTIKQNPATAQAVTQYATIRYLEGKPTEVLRYVAATRIIKIATDLESVTSGDEVTLANLRIAVTAAISELHIRQSDALLAAGLVDALIAELEVRFKGSGDVLNPDQVVVVNDVLKWVIAAASTVPEPT